MARIDRKAEEIDGDQLAFPSALSSNENLQRILTLQHF